MQYLNVFFYQFKVFTYLNTINIRQVVAPLKKTFTVHSSIDFIYKDLIFRSQKHEYDHYNYTSTSRLVPF